MFLDLTNEVDSEEEEGEERDDKEEEETSDHIKHRKIADAAVSMKNNKQETSAMKEIARRGRLACKEGVGIGAVVTLKVDWRTHTLAPGLLAIVYGFKPESGSVLVCCEHGVITHSGDKLPYWVPYERYSLSSARDQNLGLEDKLQEVRTQVLEGTWTPKGKQVLSYSRYVDTKIGAVSPVRRERGCRCKKGCKSNCGCKR